MLQRRFADLHAAPSQAFLDDAVKRLVAPLAATPEEIMQQVKAEVQRRARSRWRRAFAYVVAMLRLRRAAKLRRLYHRLVEAVHVPTVTVTDSESIAKCMELRMLQLSNAMADYGEVQAQQRSLKRQLDAVQLRLQHSEQARASGSGLSANDRAMTAAQDGIAKKSAELEVLRPLAAKVKAQSSAIKEAALSMYNMLVRGGLVAAGADVNHSFRTLPNAMFSGVSPLSPTSLGRTPSRLAVVVDTFDALLRATRPRTPQGHPQRPASAQQVVALAEGGRAAERAAVASGSPSTCLVPTTKTHWRRKSLQDVKSILALRDRLAEATLAAVQRASVPSKDVKHSLPDKVLRPRRTDGSDFSVGSPLTASASASASVSASTSRPVSRARSQSVLAPRGTTRRQSCSKPRARRRAQSMLHVASAGAPHATRRRPSTAPRQRVTTSREKHKQPGTAATTPPGVRAENRQPFAAGGGGGGGGAQVAASGAATAGPGHCREQGNRPVHRRRSRRRSSVGTGRRTSKASVKVTAVRPSTAGAARSQPVGKPGARASVSSLPDRLLAVISKTVSDVPETYHSLVLIEKSRHMMEQERRKRAAQLKLMQVEVKSGAEDVAAAGDDAKESSTTPTASSLPPASASDEENDETRTVTAAVEAAVDP